MKKEYIAKTPVTQVVDYSASVPFHRAHTICEHTLVTNDELNPILGPGLESEFYAVPSYEATYRLISDGTHAPTFGSEFTKAGKSGEWDGTLGAVNVVKFAFDGSDFTYSIENGSLGSVVDPFKGGSLYVDLTSGVDTYSGNSWTTAFRTIQKAIDTAVEGAGTMILVTGSATLTTPILCNKTNVHIYGMPSMDNHTGGNCSLTYNIDDSPLFLLSKTKLRFENLRITLGNTKTVAFSVFDNEADIAAAVALSNSMFKNINIYKNAGLNGEGNAFRLGGVTACTFDNIKIATALGTNLLGGFLFTTTIRCNFLNIYIGNCAGTAIYDPASVDTVYENIIILPTCLVGCDIAGPTSMLRDSRILATTAYGLNDSILHVGNLITVD